MIKLCKKKILVFSSVLKIIGFCFTLLWTRRYLPLLWVLLFFNRLRDHFLRNNKWCFPKKMFIFREILQILTCQEDTSRSSITFCKAQRCSVLDLSSARNSLWWRSEGLRSILLYGAGSGNCELMVRLHCQRKTHFIYKYLENTFLIII